MLWAIFGFAVVAIIVIGLLQAAKDYLTASSELNNDHRQIALVQAPASLPSLGMTATDMLHRLDELDKIGSLWPEIWDQLNPDHNDEVKQLLVDFRGPYLLNPQLGIKVLRHGCERALTESSEADRVDAIKAAMRIHYPVV